LSTDTLKLWRHLFGGQSGILAVFSGRRTGQKEIDRESAKTRYFDYPAKAESALSHALEESESGREAYFCAHLLTARRRTKENAAPALALWGESDGAELPTNGLAPTAVVESSPGRFHVYYRLTATIAPELAEKLNKRLALKIGADPSGFDLTQLLRVPGTANHKYPDTPVVRILELDGGRSYSPRELDEALPEIETKGEPRSRGASEEPPVVLGEQALRVWRGEDPKLRENGTVDRSASLVKIGRAVYDAGGNRPVIEAALEERDRTLGWNKYTGRRDATECYAGIVDELEENGRNGKARITVGGKPPNEQDASPSEEKEEKTTQAQLLVRCAEGAEFFHTPAGDAYVAVPVGDHRETHLIKSKGFRRWLVREYYGEQDRPPGAQALQDALGLLEARAQFDGPQTEVYVRVAGHAGAVYVDLANDEWEAVEITRAGWRVVPAEDLPVRFRRSRGMLPLPAPQRPRSDKDGPDDLLRRFINLEPGGRELRLLTAWLVQSLRPTGPYPILILQGEQGSAKSTLARLLRSVVDPSTAPLRTAPRNERDLIITATNSWCLAFDNISIIPPWCSDALCRLSTGGGFSARELYSDSEEVLFEATRPSILNGITDVATRPDLVDRGILVNLPRIAAEERRSEAELLEAIEEARPYILGGLFDAISGALGAVESVQLEGMPRMADFAVWAAAAESALGWEPGAFLEAYADNRARAVEGALEADPVATALQEFMASRDGWSGTAAELWDKLNDLAGENTRRSKAWPGAPNALSGRIKRLAPALRDAGIEYRDAYPDEDGRKRAKSLQKVNANHRPDRPHRTGEPENPIDKRKISGTMIVDDRRSRDDATQKIVPPETPVGKPIGDSTDGKDDKDYDLQRRSTSSSRRPASVRELLTRPPGWLQDQMNHCRKQGSPESQLKALAASVAAEFYGDVTKSAEILPEVEAFMAHGVGCECEVCL
jgi:RepB DNA-primase from phage plasmid